MNAFVERLRRTRPVTARHLAANLEIDEPALKSSDAPDSGRCNIVAPRNDARPTGLPATLSESDVCGRLEKEVAMRTCRPEGSGAVAQQCLLVADG